MVTPTHTTQFTTHTDQLHPFGCLQKIMPPSLLGAEWQKLSLIFTLASFWLPSKPMLSTWAPSLFLLWSYIIDGLPYVWCHCYAWELGTDECHRSSLSFYTQVLRIPFAMLWLERERICVPINAVDFAKISTKRISLRRRIRHFVLQFSRIRILILSEQFSLLVTPHACTTPTPVTNSVCVPIVDLPDCLHTHIFHQLTSLYFVAYQVSVIIPHKARKKNVLRGL